MRIWAGAFCVLFSASAALAADEPLFGPAPGWVEETSPPEEVDSTPGQGGYTALLADQQIRFNTAGDEVYTRSVIRIDTPQGLQGMTSVGAAWQPDFQSLTIHHLRIIRGDEVIDLLADGQTFTTLRRENSLEYAVLDGTLTAVIQPEGLRVGDIVDFASTIANLDPVVGEFAQVTVGAAAYPVERFNFSAEWPDTETIAWRTMDGFEDAKERNANGLTTVTISHDDEQPFEAPEGAPLRFQLGPRIELSEFESWEQVSAILAPLYATASTLEAESPLHAEIERIRTEHDDPREQAAAALRLAQDQVRYFFIALGQGGLMPASADETWSRRFGDCKGKTALLLALLHGLGIKADAVAVNSLTGASTPDKLPRVGAFDHVLVRATIDGETYFLDGSSTGDRRLEDMVTPLFYWGLPLTADGSDLVEMFPEPLETPQTYLDARIDYSRGLTTPAPVTANLTLQGNVATAMQIVASSLSSAERETTLVGLAEAYLPNVNIEDALGAYDDATGEYVISATGELAGQWSDYTYYSRIGRETFDPQSLMTLEIEEGRTAPYAISYPFYAVARETLILPDGASGFTIEGGASVTTAGLEISRSGTIEDNTIVLQHSARSLTDEFSTIDLEQAKDDIAPFSNAYMRIVMPTRYQPTDAEVAVARDAEPASAQDAVRQATLVMNSGDFAAAIPILDRAIADFPESGALFATRAFARSNSGNIEGAYEDVQEADRLDPTAPTTIIARANVLAQTGRARDAIAPLTRLLEREPNNLLALRSRASAYLQSGQFDAAEADAIQVLEQSPADMAVTTMLVGVYFAKGENDEAIARAEAAAAAAPDEADVHTMLGSAYAQVGNTEQAMAAINHSLGIAPSPNAYLMRAQLRPEGETEERRADLDAALALDPTYAPALNALAYLQSPSEGRDVMASLDAAVVNAQRSGNATALSAAYAARANAHFAENAYDRALADATEAIRLSPSNMDMYAVRASAYMNKADLAAAAAEGNAAIAANRNNVIAYGFAGQIYARAGRQEDAEEALAHALEIAPAEFLYLIRATIRRHADPQGAEADLHAALAEYPQSDSAYVALGDLLLTQGRGDEALDAYSRAIDIAAADETALMGRAATYLTLGRETEAEADLAAVRDDAAPVILNNLCWQLAIRNVALESALADCDAALEEQPDIAGFRDSRALVLLRLGRFEEALAEYDRVVADSPSSVSLFGRGVTKMRLDQTEAGQADIDNALRRDVTVAQEFASWGIVP